MREVVFTKKAYYMWKKIFLKDVKCVREVHCVKEAHLMSDVNCM